jgi:hypothetical protein
MKNIQSIATQVELSNRTALLLSCIQQINVLEEDLSAAFGGYIGGAVDADEWQSENIFKHTIELKKTAFEMLRYSISDNLSLDAHKTL